MELFWFFMGFITGVCALFMVLYIYALAESRKANENFNEWYSKIKKEGE